MAPRKSSQDPQSSSHASSSANPSRTMRKSKSMGGSGRTVDVDSIPVADIPETLTPEYEPEQEQRVGLDEDERERLIHDLICFHPREVCEELTKSAGETPYIVTGALQTWAENKARDIGTEEAEREVTMGLVAVETLLESHVDRATDRFTAWALRNAFDVPADLEVVLPWQQGLDFPRAKHVVDLPRGVESIEDTLESLRTKVEQARLLSHRLLVAEQVLDRRLEIAKQRRAEVGFVKDVLSTSNLNPLSDKTTSILNSLNTLHSSMSTISSDPVNPPPAPAGENPKAWEMGRQAYLNWAVGKAVSSSSVGDLKASQAGTEGLKPAKLAGTDTDTVIDDVEREMKQTGTEGIDALTRSMEQ